MTEGSNLYFTTARAITAIGTITNVASGLCPLDAGGLVPIANLPSIAIHNTYVVSSQAAMLALSGNQGDVAIRTDLSETFVLASAPASTLANWKQLLSPTSAVTSVNTFTGAVTLTTANIAENTEPLLHHRPRAGGRDRGVAHRPQHQRRRRHHAAAIPSSPHLGSTNTASRLMTPRSPAPTV